MTQTVRLTDDASNILDELQNELPGEPAKNRLVEHALREYQQEHITEGDSR